MIRVEGLDVRAPDGRLLLAGVSAAFPRHGLHAIIGPSGCGKTTLLRAIAGLVPHTAGRVTLDGTALTAHDLPGVAGFAPQFSIVPPRLTVAEALDTALALLQRDPARRAALRADIPATLGLAAHANQRVESLSGGQLRRLGLGLELCGDPEFLLCDEVTTGLDPLAENGILRLLRDLCTQRGRTVLCVLHNLGALDAFDTVTVLSSGRAAFQGTPRELRTRFGLDDPRRLFEVLEGQTLPPWNVPVPSPPGAPPTRPAVPRPGVLRQAGVLLGRRLRVFLRDRGHLAMTLALTFGFPCLVVIFALRGLPALEAAALGPPTDPVAGLLERAEHDVESARVAALVSGLVMFQVILLTLMGSNAGAREIAGERPLYEKERLAGVSPVAYVLAKLAFTGALTAAQGLWMMVFVKTVCGFPGDWLQQGAVLAATAVAMGFVCLGLSAVLASAEKASLFSVYFVGFQLPLSGVVLALPDWLVWTVRPFISAYWGWSGYLDALRASVFFDAVQASVDTLVAPVPLALGVLGAHAVVGAALVLWGCERRRWP
jgi:ABC-type multidrug transport system ATPase subunit